MSRKIHWSLNNDITACYRQCRDVVNVTFKEMPKIPQDERCKSCDLKWDRVTQVKSKLKPYNLYQGNIFFTDTNWQSHFFLCKIDQRSNTGFKLDFILWLNHGKDILLKRNKIYDVTDILDWTITPTKVLSDTEKSKLKTYYKLMSI